MERLNYYDVNIKFNRQSLKEVWEILKEYNKIDKIPEKYIWLIEDNMDKDYVFFVDNFETTMLSEDTKKILTFLYTDFLSTSEERIVLKKLEKIQYEEKQQKLREKFKSEMQVYSMQKQNTNKLENENNLISYEIIKKRRIELENNNIVVN